MSENAAQPESLYRGKFLELVRAGHWEYVRRTKGSTPVGIVALTDAGEVILISQYRVPTGKVCVEMPAGLVGDSDTHAGEEWQLAARRELEEETGYTAQRFTMLSEGATSAGLTSELIKLVRAHGVTLKGAATPDGDEQIEVHLVPLKDADAFLQAQAAAGRLIDPKVYAGLYFLNRG